MNFKRKYPNTYLGRLSLVFSTILIGVALLGIVFTKNPPTGTLAMLLFIAFILNFAGYLELDIAELNIQRLVSEIWNHKTQEN
jgi:tryptophan-rich sensory protein